MQLSLIAESDEVQAILETQSHQVQPHLLVEQLMKHAIMTPDILKAHLTPGAFHRDGQLIVPIEDLRSGYGLQGREVRPDFPHRNNCKASECIRWPPKDPVCSLQG